MHQKHDSKRTHSNNLLCHYKKVLAATSALWMSLHLYLTSSRLLAHPKSTMLALSFSLEIGLQGQILSSGTVHQQIARSCTQLSAR